MSDTGQDTNRMIDACFSDYLTWYTNNYPGALNGLKRETLESWWDDEVGLTAWMEKHWNTR